MNQDPSPFYEFGPFRLDAAKNLLVRGGDSIPLSPKVFETLLLLVQHSGQVLSKARLMECLWPDSFVEESNLTQNIFVLRKALGGHATRPSLHPDHPRQGLSLYHAGYCERIC